MPTRSAIAIEANSIKNNGSTVVYGNTSRVGFNTPGNSVVSALKNRCNSIPAGPYTAGEQGDYTHNVAKAISSASHYGTQTARQFIINGYSSYVAGSANSILSKSGGMNQRVSIHARETIRSLKTYGAVLNILTGQYTTTLGSQLDEFKQLGGTLSDDAAHPTLEIPGEFVVKYGARNDPQMKDYSERFAG